MTDVDLSERDGVLIFHLKGDLNAVSAPATQSAIVENISNGNTQIVLDLSALNFIASAGLRVLLIAARQLASKSAKLFVIAGSEHIMEVLEISGVLTVVQVEPDEATAIASVKSVPHG